MEEKRKLLTLSAETNAIICRQTGATSIEELDNKPFGSFSDVPLTTSAVMKIWKFVQLVIRGNVAMKQGHFYDTFELDNEFRRKTAKLRLP